MARQSTTGPRDKREKARRRPPVPAARVPVAARPRVAPVGATFKPEDPAVATKPRVPGAMDFSYVGAELRRIAMFAAGMIVLLVVLSPVFG